jgi:hypothetical protein
MSGRGIPIGVDALDGVDPATLAESVRLIDGVDPPGGNCRLPNVMKQPCV